MVRLTAETLSVREIQEKEYEKEAWEKQAAHQLALKDKEIEVMKLEAKWSSLLKLPLTIIKLPLLLLFVIPLTVYAVKRQPIPEQYWSLLK